jgi:hypothetical protein
VDGVGFTLSSATTLTATFSATATPNCLLQLTTTANSSNGTRSISVQGDPFSVLLNQDCSSFGPTQATLIMLKSIFDATRVTFSTKCGTTLLTMVCSGVTVADADTYCQAILNSINTPGSYLNTQFNPVTSGGGSSSNKGLYGLLALIAIPVIILLFLLIWFMRRKEEPGDKDRNFTNDHLAMDHQEPITEPNVRTVPEPVVKTLETSPRKDPGSPTHPAMYAVPTGSIYSGSAPAPSYTPPPTPTVYQP